MKILHITASYKPAFIYGGPIYSVAALCEALVENRESKVESRKSKVKGEGEGLETDVESERQEGSPESEVESQKSKVKSEGPEIEVESEKQEGSPESEVGSKREAGIKKEGLVSDSICLSAFQAYLPKGEKNILVEVYTTLANGKEELPYQDGEVRMVNGVSVHYFRRITKDHSHFSPALLWRVWKDAKKYDAIHIHSWWNLVSMGAVLICILRGIKPIVSPRGMLGDYTFTRSKRLFHRIFGRFLLRRCNFHATTMMEAEEIAKRVGRWKSEVRGRKSEVGSQRSEVLNTEIEILDLMEDELGGGSWELVGGSPESEVRSLQSEDWTKKIQEPRFKKQEKIKRNAKIFVIHNIVQLPEPLPQRSRVFDGTLKLIFLSRIHPKKGIELLLEALAEVDFPFQFTIVGEGEEAYVKGLKLKVESLKLNDYIHWKGAIYGKEKFEYLADHDLLILPSFNENFANVVIESVAVGTPVLISDQVGLHQYISQNHLGLVHELNKLSLLSQLMQFKESITSGFSIEKDFSSLRLVEKYVSLYHA